MQHINLLCDGFNDFSYNGIDVYNNSLANENFFFIEYLIKQTDLSVKRVNFNYFENDVDEDFYFLLPFFDIKNFNDLIDIFKSNSHFITQLKKLFNHNKTKIIFYDFHEKTDENDITNFLNFLSKSKIDTTRFYIINNDFNIKYYKEKNNWNLGGVYKTNHLTYHTSGRMLSYDVKFKKEKNNFFLCKNKVGKIHRIAIISFLKKYFKTDTNYSILNPKSNFDKFDYSDYFNLDNNEWLISTMKETQISEAVNTGYEFDKTGYLNDSSEEFIDFAGDLSLRDYEESFINITTESVFFENNIHITEKSFKSFGLYQLPLFVASYNHVKTLREYYGFDLFDDIIDHSYDLEIDNTKRLFMIFDEIKRLYSIKDKIMSFYKNNEVRLESNRNVLKKIYQTNMDSYIIKSIIKN